MVDMKFLKWHYLVILEFVKTFSIATDEMHYNTDRFSVVRESKHKKSGQQLQIQTQIWRV